MGLSNSNSKDIDSQDTGSSESTKSNKPIVYYHELTPEMINYTVYVILGNDWGDEGKGKMMRFYLIEQVKKAKMSIRFNGGPNAGHTVIVKVNDPELFISDTKREEYQNKGFETIKLATHQVPTGVLFGVRGIIGYNCVVDLLKLNKEIQEISTQLGRTYDEIAKLIVIVPEAHLILDKHIQQDKENNKVGTTSSGIGPAYSDKALRTGIQIGHYFQSDIKSGGLAILTQSIMTLDPSSFSDNKIIGVTIGSCRHIAKQLEEDDVVVMEGAQGFNLDINLGDYPYVTSSDCTIGSACSYGFDLQSLYIVGCSKAYATYVGAQRLEPDFDSKIPYSGYGELKRLLGKEYGVTTGRRRQCLPMNLERNIEALRLNQTRDWIISKSDILEEYNVALSKLQEQMDSDFEYVENLNSATNKIDKILYTYIKSTNQDVELYKKLIKIGAFTIEYNKQIITFNTWNEMQCYIIDILEKEKLHHLERIIWYDSPESEFELEKY
jgi:adenylosuccinate synthase